MGPKKDYDEPINLHIEPEDALGAILQVDPNASPRDGTHPEEEDESDE